MTRSEVLTKATVYRDLENFLLKERSQTQRTTLVWGRLQPSSARRAEGRFSGSGAGGREGRPAATPGSCWGMESKEGSWAAGLLLGEGGGARRGVLLGMEGRERSPGGWKEGAVSYSGAGVLLGW